MTRVREKLSLLCPSYCPGREEGGAEGGGARGGGGWGGPRIGVEAGVSSSSRVSHGKKSLWSLSSFEPRTLLG